MNIQIYVNKKNPDVLKSYYVEEGLPLLVMSRGKYK